MLRTILSPPKCQKIDNLWASVESWEEAVRQYEHRKRSDGTRHQLDDEIKVSILEQMCPVKIERHLQLNRSRYTDYNDVRSELVLYLETRLGQRLKIGDASGANLGDPMDVGGFEKGKGKDKKGVKGKGKNKGSYGGKGKGGKSTGKGKGSGKGSGSGNPNNGGKETRTCNNCGKPGHLRKDCWSAGGGAANKGQKSKGKSKGKGKGVNNLEEEPEAETAETGFLSIAGLEELDVKMEDDHEDVKLEHVAAITAVPRALAEEGLVRGDREASSTSYKTASGELLEDEGGVLVNGYDHQGRRLVNVHRTLASGTEVAKKNMVVLNGDGGKIIPRGSKIAMEMDKHLKRLMKQYPEEAEKLTEMYVQKGIYVFDLWVQNGSGGSSRDGDLGAVDFHRQAKL